MPTVGIKEVYISSHDSPIPSVSLKYETRARDQAFPMDHLKGAIMRLLRQDAKFYFRDLENPRTMYKAEFRYAVEVPVRRNFPPVTHAVRDVGGSFLLLHFEQQNAH
jgi:hypothetical protein